MHIVLYRYLTFCLTIGLIMVGVFTFIMRYTESKILAQNGWAEVLSTSALVAAVVIFYRCLFTFFKLPCHALYDSWGCNIVFDIAFCLLKIGTLSMAIILLYSGDTPAIPLTNETLSRTVSIIIFVIIVLFDVFEALVFPLRKSETIKAIMDSEYTQQFDDQFTQLHLSTSINNIPLRKLLNFDPKHTLYDDEECKAGHALIEALSKKYSRNVYETASHT